MAGLEDGHRHAPDEDQTVILFCVRTYDVSYATVKAERKGRKGRRRRTVQDRDQHRRRPAAQPVRCADPRAPPPRDQPRRADPQNRAVAVDGEGPRRGTGRPAAWSRRSPARRSAQVGRPSPIVRPRIRLLAIAVNPEVDADHNRFGGTGRHGARRGQRCPTDRRPHRARDRHLAAEAIERMRRTLGRRPAPSPRSVSPYPAWCTRRVRGPAGAHTSTGMMPRSVRCSARQRNCRSSRPTTPMSARSPSTSSAVTRTPDHMIYVNGGASGIGAGFVVAGELLEGAAGLRRRARAHLRRRCGHRAIAGASAASKPRSASATAR